MQLYYFYLRNLIGLIIILFVVLLIPLYLNGSKAIAAVFWVFAGSLAIMLAFDLIVFKKDNQTFYYNLGYSPLAIAAKLYGVTLLLFVLFEVVVLKIR
jgi:hypothetical protein